MNDQDQAKWDAELREVVASLRTLKTQSPSTLNHAAVLIEQMRTTFTHKANLLPLREACEAALNWMSLAKNTTDREEAVALIKQLEDALRGSASLVP